jgi:hypothetical protein
MKIEFSELLNKIGDEIRAANKRAVDEDDAVMEFVECEVEIAFSVEQEANGGIKLYIFELGAGETSVVTNTIKLKYQSLGNTWAAVAKEE